MCTTVETRARSRVRLRCAVGRVAALHRPLLRATAPSMLSSSSKPADYSESSLDEFNRTGKDVGETGALVPEGVEVPAKLIGEEMLSRASLKGPNAIAFVFSHMQNDPREEVQAAGCLALAQISERPDGRVAVSDNGGIEIIVAAMMSAGSEEIEVLAHGCSALANLALGEGEMAVIAKSGLDAVLEAARTHPKEVAIQRKACLALGNLAFGSEGEATVLATGGLEAVVAAMKAHGKDEVVVEEGIDALVNIADSTGGKKRLLGCGGLEVVAAARKHAKVAAAATDLEKQLSEIRGDDATADAGASVETLKPAAEAAVEAAAAQEQDLASLD